MTPRTELILSDRVAHLVIGPPPGNALDLACFEELGTRIREEAPALKPMGLVVRGAGRHFSSGADIDALSRLFREEPDRGAALVAIHGEILSALERLPFPTAAAISGSCLGAGLELALACRYRVAAKNAVLSLPETEFGMMPGLGGVVRLSALVGPSLAAQLVLSGRTVCAEEALEMGLVDAVFSREELVPSSAALVARAAQKAPPTELP